ncbi:MAG TPA: histidine kinase dimerization/phospho-acceptor domain-containing protein [Sphingomicrobium sp.]|nr:histidine kinase dimerization/phospho-acceptor domain-containing protein [Sphingomicrobium sp.]
MRFDDRLLTVLNQPAEDRHDVAVRWRQLVDLVARSGASSASPMISQALEAIRTEAPRVAEPLRAAAARAVAALPVPLGLLEYFVTDRLAVSAPVLASASLDDVQWQRLRALADEETRGFIEALHPETGGERGANLPAPQPPSQTEVTENTAYVPPSVHDVVERIEERRRMRSIEPVSSSAPSTSELETSTLFRWECGPGGEIAWVDGVPRGALIGRSIAKSIEGGGDHIDHDVVRAFNLRAPFRDRLVAIAAAGSASGEWKISGMPAFDPADGRFAGYRGIAVRETSTSDAQRGSEAEAIPDVLADPASLRELVHEIKTPLNAIIGFAEIIEGQYLGPADRGYRSRAFEIVRQARLLLTAIDDLDFAAKAHSAGTRRDWVDLAALVDREAQSLRDFAEQRRVNLQVIGVRFDVPAKVEPELANRLLFRLFGALADLAEPGEVVQLHLELTNDRAFVVFSRPKSIRELSEAELFGSTSDGGLGRFMLRIARGLARIAGGNLISRQDTIAFVFPRG